MNQTIKIILGIAILVLGFTACGEKNTPATTEPVKPESGPGIIDSASLSKPITVKELPAAGSGEGKVIFIHISSGPDERFKVCMALKMAEEMAVKYPVRIYLDHHATAIGLKETPEIEWAPFPPAKAQIKKLITAGVSVSVCDPCLQSLWKKPSDLIQGIQSVALGDALGTDPGQYVTMNF